ncbi:hypothetical protein COCCADRAFT_31762 [Bipolaris zeicola 26-R-13]|uniref:Uncharacterized protein n=1 Tax=Cochliobolus carbonum (strain 26-R-13) TaxID=930089 RepID=W6YP00_COCC2|nr:uncharacterized protein COCCADRAFT_31762 [Bipolaris zeicola 26-R-13]EUC39380.1 hypothetical protein COCCADRAFT_31762 [Bipolaris zeicola 26-R-13]
MKLVQLITLFGGAALAVQFLVAPHSQRALNDTHSTVVMVTSTHMVSEICTDVARCPPYTTEVQTSVIHVTDTTTVCLLSSTPSGYMPPVSATTTLPATSSVYPTESRISVSIIPGSYISMYPSFSVSPQTSVLTTEVTSSSVYVLPSIPLSQPSVSVSHGPTPKPSVSISYTATSAPVISISSATSLISITDTVGSSYPVSSVGSSSAGYSSASVSPPTVSVVPSYADSSSVATHSSTAVSHSYPGPNTPSSLAGTSTTDFVPVPTYVFDTTSTPGYVLSYTATPSSSNTNTLSASSTASYPGANFVRSSSGEYVFSTGSTVVPISPTVPSPTWPSSSGYTIPSGSLSPWSPTYPSSTVLESTNAITSYHVHLSTSYITASASSSGLNNHTETSAQTVPTYVPSGISAGPSGSDYPYPYASANRSIIGPSPSYMEVPFNTGHRIGARRWCGALVIMILCIASWA